MTTTELELVPASASPLSTATNMKALVYHGPAQRAWEDKPRPIIQDAGDAIVRITTSGGRIANVGVHGKPVELHLEKLWDRNIAITTRLVDTVTTPMLLKVVRSGKLQPSKLVTHRFALNDIMKAYDTFGNAAKEGALKVVLTNSAAGYHHLPLRQLEMLVGSPAHKAKNSTEEQLHFPSE